MYVCMYVCMYAGIILLDSIEMAGALLAHQEDKDNLGERVQERTFTGKRLHSH